MFEENMIVQLKGIGMSDYEAKVYLTLICINSASTRELHETTNIPRGRVYETLASLEKKGFIISNSFCGLTDRLYRCGSGCFVMQNDSHLVNVEIMAFAECCRVIFGKSGKQI